MPTCEFCAVDFESPRELTYHMSGCVERPDDARYKCRICGNKYVSEGDLKDHLGDCAEDDSPTTHQCSTCGEAFDAVQALIEHNRSCSGPAAGPTAPEATGDDVVERDITGLVTHFDVEEGYGFITTYDLEAHQSAEKVEADVFFHESDYPGDQPEEGERLRFDAKRTDDGYSAVEIAIAEQHESDTWETRFASERVRWDRDT